MGGVARIRKRLGRGGKSVCMVDTGLVFGGRRIMIALEGLGEGKAVVSRFRAFMGRVMGRSGCMNVYDLYRVTFEVQRRLKAGDSVWN